MAELRGHAQVFHSNTSIIDSTQVAVLGMRGIDGSGNEYIYLKGVGSTEAGSWVVYDEDYATTLLTAGEVGPVAIAMAAVDSTSEYGWYQIFGVNTVAKTDTISADSALYIDGTSGRVDDLGVAGDLVIGAYSMTADTSNVATVFLTYPSVSNDLGGSSNFADKETPSGSINSSNTSFTLANSPNPEASLILVQNGTVRNSGAGNDFTLSGATITFATAPQTGDVLLAWYRY